MGEEYSIEVHRIITEQKEKSRQSHEKKVKQMETQYAIAKSTAINKRRLEKIKARQEVLASISNDVKAKIVSQMSDRSKHEKLIKDLIVQGLLMFLENEVTVRCRECDKDIVSACLQKAEDEYTKVIEKQTGVKKTCKLSRDSTYLPPPPKAGQDGPSCLGGVVLSCQGGKISIDNTLDLRLNLVMEQDKPAIRNKLFPHVSPGYANGR